MTYHVVLDPRFKSDYRRIRREYPQVARELAEVIDEFVQNGELPDAYGAHELLNPGGNYNGYWEFHLSDGAVDVLVIYIPRRREPVIRFVRMGSHRDLFQGPLR